MILYLLPLCFSYLWRLVMSDAAIRLKVSSNSSYDLPIFLLCNRQGKLTNQLSFHQESQTKTRKSTRTSDYSSSASSIPSPVQPESRLAYGLTFDRLHGRLYVRVIQLGNFRVTDPDGALSPYVKVRVYRTPRHFFTFKLK